MKTRICSTIVFVVAGLLMAQAASALDLSTPAFKQGEKIPSSTRATRPV